MNKPPRFSRRKLITSGSALGLSTLHAGPAGAADASCQRFKPLAQDYSIAARIPGEGIHYIHDPGMAKLPSGRFFVAAPRLELQVKPRRRIIGWRLLLARSSDGGRTWESLPTLNYSDAIPFVHEGRLYMFVQPEKWKDVSLVVSEDEGRTWTEPAAIFSGSFWNCHTGMVVSDGRLHWALSTQNYEGGVVIIAGNLSKNLLEEDSWSMSSEAAKPEVPHVLVRGMYPQMSSKWGQWDQNWWLEPNVVFVNGRMRVLLRTVMDQYATSSIAAVCDLTIQETRMSLDFTQYYPVPGAQNKFFIRYDAPSRLFWMISNLPADTQELVLDWDQVRSTGRFLGGPGNDRRFLMLFYSVDALNWFPAGCIARALHPGQSFMYPVFEFDGDDIVLISRSSVNGRNQHDADLVTFHRISSFRSLAMQLYPERLSG